MTQILERSREYKLPTYCIFVDYEKAFDSVELNAVLQALVQQGAQRKYIEILREANTGCSTRITFFNTPISIPISTGVKQRDTISPKLFSACLEMVIRRVNWKKLIRIDGEHLTHLRFADDLVLLGEDADTVQKMLNELEKEGRRVGLRINRSKIKLMRSQCAPEMPITLEDEAIEEVGSYVDLGQEVNTSNDLTCEILRRRKTGWLKFNEEKEVLLSKIDPKRNAEIFNTTVLPAMIYGCETWAPTKVEERKLETTVRAMERAMLRISLRDRTTNEEIRTRTGIRDITQEIRKSRIKWAGHVGR
ncbi:hypothetical protein Y032_0029g1939 [Ancylostoma ceylanicum]|uniref:Reverse transcriptase domain-containing protein n=1 Tax=Ancylostoma ceylanicum TaxID=53326 RepID=A0A016UTT3_9BILA|nr:hypothetical protein Y032_0029g1939 [Ancylostoma ceylanicum]